MRPLTDEEIARVSQAFEERGDSRDLALFLTGYSTGLRISELLSIRVGDVFEAGTIKDKVTIRRKHMKGKREGRTVNLPPLAQRAIRALLRKLPPSPDTFLFKSQRGFNKPITRVYAWMIYDRVFRSVGMTGRLGTHSTRKTFAEKIYSNPRINKDLVKMRAALGHKDINSTVQYLSFLEDDIDGAVTDIFG